MPPAPPSEETRNLLKDLGLEDEGEQNSWAARLALPVLSARELQAVRSYLYKGGWLTPRRMAILILARRLGLEAPHVARRIAGADEEGEFKNHAGEYSI